AVIIPFPPTATNRDFQVWREAWHRQVLADRQLGHRDKSVAGILLWYLNRQDRTCFPSYETIAKGVGITRRDAMRSIARLVKCGHPQRQPGNERPTITPRRWWHPLPPDGGGKLDTLTCRYRTSDLGKSASSPSATPYQNIPPPGVPPGH